MMCGHPGMKIGRLKLNWITRPFINTKVGKGRENELDGASGGKGHGKG